MSSAFRLSKNKTHLIDNLLRNIVLNVRRDSIVNPPVQLHAVFGLGPQALLNTVINDTAYEGGFDSEPAKYNLSW